MQCPILRIVRSRVMPGVVFSVPLWLVNVEVLRACAWPRRVYFE